MAGQDHNALIRDIAKERLGPMGLRQKGRSRTWLDDHGWWLIVVGFQPSGWSKGTYCNIGFNHLWFVSDHLAFEEPERVSTGSGRFIQFSPKAPQSFEPKFVSLVNAVAGVIDQRRVSHGSSESDALERLARRSGDLYVDYHAGAAAGLLGWRRAAAEAFDRVIAVKEHAPWVAGVKDQAASLAALLDTPSALALELSERVNRTRAALNLEPALLSWSPHRTTDPGQ